MRGFYTATLANQSYTVANGDADLIKIKAPTDACIVIHSIYVGQSSDAGDALAQMVRIQLKRGQGTFTENSGSSITAAKHDDGDQGATATVTGFNATVAVAGTGTLEVVREECFNVQAGWFYQPVPEERIVLRPTISTDLSALVIHIPSTLTSDITISASVIFQEVG